MQWGAKRVALGDEPDLGQRELKNVALGAIDRTSAAFRMGVPGSLVELPHAARHVIKAAAKRQSVRRKETRKKFSR